VLEVLTNPDVKGIAKKFYTAQVPDKAGRLGFEDLRRVLKALNEALSTPMPSLSTAEQLFKRYDFNGDQSLDFDEFFELFISSLRRVAFDPSPLLGRDVFVQKEPGKVWDFYKATKKLGEGSFGAAYLCKHRKSGDERVVKSAAKSKVKIPVEDVEREIMIMMQLDHPHVIRLHSWYEGASSVYLVMDALKGGTVRDVVTETFTLKGKGVKEEWIRTVIRQVIEAMAYCHSKRVIHKDLKDENVVLVKKDPNYDAPFAVIIDLGVSEMFASGVEAGRVMGGTPTTMAPEVWMSNFGPKCDVWSVGCILFELCAGTMPFCARTLDPRDWTSLHRRGADWFQMKTSDGSKSLCKTMLTYNDCQRPSMRDCTQHKWFTASRDTLRTVSPELVESLKAFCKQADLKRTLLLELAAKLPIEHTERIMKEFRDLDANGDGGITKKELGESFARIGIKDEKLLDQIFRALDANDDGSLSISEFTAGAMMMYKDLLDDRFRAHFRRHDQDSDGALTRPEATEFLSGASQYLCKKDARNNQKLSAEQQLNLLFPDGRKMFNYEDLKNKILTVAQ
jgi:serine/threonine protein kinase